MTWSPGVFLLRGYVRCDFRRHSESCAGVSSAVESRSSAPARRNHQQGAGEGSRGPIPIGCRPPSGSEAFETRHRLRSLRCGNVWSSAELNNGCLGRPLVAAKSDSRGGRPRSRGGSGAGHLVSLFPRACASNRLDRRLAIRQRERRLRCRVSERGHQRKPYQQPLATAQLVGYGAQHGFPLQR